MSDLRDRFKIEYRRHNTTMLHKKGNHYASDMATNEINSTCPKVIMTKLLNQ